MPDENRQEGIHIPGWMVAILVSTLAAILGTVFYAGQTYGKLQEMDRRLTRIEDGVDLLWQNTRDGPIKPAKP